MLTVRGLSARYAGALVLSDISLEIGQGEAWVLAGRNGAGKSTLLKSLIGLLPPASGTIRFRGHEIAGLAPFRIARLGLGYVPEERRIFADLTVAENLRVARRPGQGDMTWSEARVMSLFPVLAELRTRRAGTLSGGEQQMLTIARTLVTSPVLLALDEPGEGLAPLIVRALVDALAVLKSSGTTLLIAEQNLRFTAGLADHAAVIEHGRVVWRGASATLGNDRGLRERYLAV